MRIIHTSMHTFKRCDKFKLRTNYRSFGRCTFKWLQHFLEWVDLLTHGANIYAWHHTQKFDDCVVVCRLVSFSSASKKAETSLSTNCICLFLLSLVAIIFHPPFLDFFFHPDGIFLGRHLRHLFVTRFIKSTFSSYNVYNNRNHVHSPQISIHVQRTSPQGLSKKSEGTMMTKENLFMSLKVNVRCQFVYS